MIKQVLEPRYLTAKHLAQMEDGINPSLQNEVTLKVDRFDRNGVQMIRSNGKGIALLNQKDLEGMRVTGWVWQVPASLPKGLHFGSDARRPGQFLLCPSNDMTLAAYCSLLSRMAMHSGGVQRT